VYKKDWRSGAASRKRISAGLSFMVWILGVLEID
jgi:hypothetical protein